MKKRIKYEGQKANEKKRKENSKPNHCPINLMVLRYEHEMYTMKNRNKYYTQQI